MKQKNIWVINQFAGTPLSGWGERHYYFSKYWLDAGYKVNIISGSYNHMFNNLPHAPDTYNFEEIEGRNFCWVKTPHYNPQSYKRFWSMIVFAWRVLKLPIAKLGLPDVIVVSSMPIFPIITAYKLKKKYGIKNLFFEIRDLWPLTPMYLGNYSKNHPFIIGLAKVEKFGYLHADKIISLLPNSANYINNISKNESKFSYIPNGLSEDILKNDPLDVEVINKIPKDKFIIGYAGTLGLANALEYFIDAARLLKIYKNIHFVIVGDGYLKDALIKRAGLVNNITFIKRIKKNQVQNLLELFDVCFVGRNNSPLFKHGVSANKYFDYMLAGKPVLDSNLFIKDPIELSGGGIIVEPDSASAIAYGALQLYKMTEAERKEIGKKGKNFVKSYHSIEYLATEYIKLFEEKTN